ncbi:MAG: winged helix-turn-helix transcriptional regulator [Calditrichaeota bacterium]|nr:winged helix-turn-helix transcriptional regulator [Calditrichota bacterium]
MRSVVKKFKALSDPNRIRILKMLEQKQLAVSEITFVLGLLTSTVSQHLSLLRDWGFIQDVKEGKWVIYHLDKKEMNESCRELFFLVSRGTENLNVIHQDAEKLKKTNLFDLCKGHAKEQKGIL